MQIIPGLEKRKRIAVFNRDGHNVNAFVRADCVQKLCVPRLNDAHDRNAAVQRGKDGRPEGGRRTFQKA